MNLQVLLKKKLQRKKGLKNEVKMKRLEEMAGTAVSTLNTLKVQDSTIRASIGEVSGPVNVIDSNNPLALVTVSAPFVAKG